MATVLVLLTPQHILRIAIAGAVSATEALRDACQSLKDVCLHVKQTFEDANAEFDANEPQDMQS